MRKSVLLLVIAMVMTCSAVFARSNGEISRQLYSVANQVCKTDPVRCDEMKSNVSSFLIDANMLNFNEDRAVWRRLPEGWYYDSRSVQHIFLRHIGVYKSPKGTVMGIFDVNCEDYNDMQERFFGYVIKTEVYFSPSYKPQRGRSLGLMKTFCK